MQEALRFLQPDAEPLDRADFIEQARVARHGSRAAVARAAADHPRPAKIVRRQRGAARHRPAHSRGPVRRHRRPQRLRQEHAAAVDRGTRDHRRRHHRFWRGSAPRRRQGDVPGAAAAALGAGAVECRGRPWPRSRIAGRAGARRPGADRSRPRRQARPVAGGAVRRTEAARGAGARAGQPSPGAGLRRAARRARCADAYLDAAAAGAGLARPGLYRGSRHPRRVRSRRAGRPGAGDRGRPHRA